MIKDGNISLAKISSRNQASVPSFRLPTWSLNIRVFQNSSSREAGVKSTHTQRLSWDDAAADLTFWLMPLIPPNPFPVFVLHIKICGRRMEDRAASHNKTTNPLWTHFCWRRKRVQNQDMQNLGGCLHAEEEISQREKVLCLFYARFLIPNSRKFECVSSPSFFPV